MKIQTYIRLVIFLLIIAGNLYPNAMFGQTRAKIENVDFTQDGTNLIITYDIVKSRSNEMFQVWVHIYTKTGKKILPTALSGDVGNNIEGGLYKRIVWDMEADQIFLDEEISVDVYGQKETKKADVKAEEENKVDEVKPVEKYKPKKEGISVAGAMGLSLALPGLGRKVVNQTGSAWVLGVAGYACIGGAVFLNNSAYNNYENYKTATSTNMRNDYYKKAKNYDLYSKVLVGTAAAIWVADLVFTAITAKKARTNVYNSNLSFSVDYNPVVNQPLIGLKYSF